ncbi:redoxin domain-containing protein (plasmid) [Deinococcus aquaticus]|uniref:Redoxin domain-containing protein n=1 Tax=Deinococcus aquaticus TaxID=328692 RepID=A0ABY7V6I1_9DEIO|nr:redoxin domain-containing protein [Deinococcus aquaticus]WDA60799.1 redoxin domain-containing protein [Deinococcus aquaticus]
MHAWLEVGQVAPDFVLPALGGGDVRLSALRERRMWLSFNRQSTCAICNPRHAAVIATQSYLAPLGIQTVIIWGSPVADLALGIRRQRPQYPVLADPDDHTYARYGLTHSLRGTRDPRNLSTIMQGFAMMGAAALKSDGDLLRMPAELLIGPDGVIERAHYAAFGTNFLPLEDVIAWSQGGDLP